LTDRDRQAFVDRTTRSVLGLDRYLDRSDPDTDPGRRMFDAPATYGPEDHSQWQAEMDALEATERWLDDHAGAHDDVRHALARLPDVTAVTSRLDARPENPLRDSDLFQLKQFTYFGRRAASAAEGLIAEYDAPPNIVQRLEELSESIHPGTADSPRFHLSSELDAELEATLGRREQTREALCSAREPLEDAVVDRFGGSFDLQGRYRPAEATDVAELEEADELERDGAGWRLASEKVDDLEAELDDIEDDLEEIEHRVRRELTDELASHSDWLARVGDVLRNLDLRLAKVRLKRRIDGCWGEWEAADTGSTLAIEGGQAPHLRENVDDAEIQPIDFALGQRAAVITGPNMGGKSSLLVLAGVCLWCAQHAMPVPAERFAFRPVHGIRYVGSEEPTALDADAGLSAFGREVRRLVDTHSAADPPTLWLLDEVGRGTHPDDGSALAIEVIERLHDDEHDILAATHFPAVAAHDAFDLFQIRGIVDPESLHQKLDGTRTLEQMESVLREAIDFQPETADAGSVPRGARIVAAALGLEFENSE